MMVRGSRAGRRKARPRPRPSPTVRRKSARPRFSPRRAIAALVMVAAAAAMYGVAVSPAFAVRTVETYGAALTGDAAVLAALDLAVSAPSAAPAAGDILSTDASSGAVVSSVDESAGNAVPPEVQPAVAPDILSAAPPDVQPAAPPDVPPAAPPAAAAENVFTLRTGPLAARVVTLPTIASATVTAALPDVIRVDIVEREPILVWSVGERRLLVDRDGLVLLDASAADAPTAAVAAARALPAIVDERHASAGLAAGDRVDPLDLDVATRLASLTPKDVGTKAKSLDVRVTAADGWVVGPTHGWEAIFGLYTATVRRPDVVPEQVRLLGSILAGREAQLGTIYLASGEAGTYTLR